MPLWTVIALLISTLLGAGLDEEIKTERVLAVSTNIPYDITYVPGYGVTSIPSVGMEFYPAGNGRWTFGLDVECPMWAHPEDHRYMQVNNLTFNTRWYFLPKYTGNHKGLYALASAGAARFGIGFNAKGWQGEGFHLSAGMGYKVPLGKAKRFFLDMGLAFGWLHAYYDPYVWGNDSTGRYYYDFSGNPEEFIKRNKGLDLLWPTRAWLSVGVELFKRKAK